MCFVSPYFIPGRELRIGTRSSTGREFDCDFPFSLRPPRLESLTATVYEIKMLNRMKRQRTSAKCADMRPPTIQSPTPAVFYMQLQRLRNQLVSMLNKRIEASKPSRVYDANSGAFQAHEQLYHRRSWLDRRDSIRHHQGIHHGPIHRQTSRFGASGAVVVYGGPTSSGTNHELCSRHGCLGKQSADFCVVNWAQLASAHLVAALVSLELFEKEDGRYFHPVCSST